MRPSAIVDVEGRVTGCPASSEARILAAPVGSTPITLTAGLVCLTAAATPDASVDHVITRAGMADGALG